jgi:Na+/melibiose symporter-like transporter
MAAMFALLVISGLVAAVTTGLLLQRLGPGLIMLGAMGAFCVGNLILATMPVGQTYWAQTFVAVVVMPWGSKWFSDLNPSQVVPVGSTH